MALGPAVTPLERMRQQLVSRSLAGLGIEEVHVAVASRQLPAPQPPLLPRRVSFTVNHPPPPLFMLVALLCQDHLVARSELRLFIFR